MTIPDRSGRRRNAAKPRLQSRTNPVVRINEIPEFTGGRRALPSGVGRGRESPDP
jgi:hypothetical protein